MADILVLEDIAKEAILHKEGPLVLAGKPDWITSGGVNYDFLFHTIKNVPYEALKNKGFLTVPLIPASDRTIAKLKAYDLHRKNPSLTMFASKSEKKVDHTTEKGIDRKTGLYLDFYDAAKHPLGTSVTERDNYSMIGENELKRFVQGRTWDDFKRHLDELRKQIDEIYSSATSLKI